MAFTYSASALTTPLAKVRLEIGDTDQATALFQDEEIQAKLADRGDNVLLAAADLCDILARRFARHFDFESDNQRFTRSQMSKQYAALARDLRDRASGGVTSVPSTRVDGYSQDVTNTDVMVADVNPRRRYYPPKDAPF